MKIRRAQAVTMSNIEAVKTLAGSDSQQETTSATGTSGVDTTAVDTSTSGTGGVDTTKVDTSTSGTGGVDTTAVLTTTSGTSGDDTIAVLPDEHYRGDAGADHFVFQDAGHYKIDDFNASEGDRLDFSKYGLSREELASHVTNVKIEADNLIINFGDNVDITLAGVQPGQISWDDVIVVDHGGHGKGGMIMVVKDDHGGSGGQGGSWWIKADQMITADQAVKVDHGGSGGNG